MEFVRDFVFIANPLCDHKVAYILTRVYDMDLEETLAAIFRTMKDA